MVPHPPSRTDRRMLPCGGEQLPIEPRIRGIEELRGVSPMGPSSEVALPFFPDSLSSHSLTGPSRLREGLPTNSVWRRMWLAWAGLVVAAFGWVVNGW